VLEFVRHNIWLFLAAVLSGGFLIWPLIAKRLSGAREVGAVEAVQLINRRDAVVLDVREPGEFDGGHIAGAKNFPVGAIEKRAGDLARFREKPVLIVCATANRSHAAFNVLRKLGFVDVHILSGGMNAWRQASLPLEK